MSFIQKNIVFGILLHAIVKMRNFLARTIDNSTILCHEMIEETVPTSLNENKAISKAQNFHILLAFLLIIITLLTAVNSYCYFIKFREK